MVKYWKLPRVNRALMPDAVATTAGAAFGTSTVTCYIESSTGIAEGGRTGLTSVVTACLFLSALFFAPLVRMIGGGYVVGGTTFYPITAPVLIIVGCLMARPGAYKLAPMGRGFAILPDSRWDATYFQYCGWYGTGVYILSTDQTVLR